MSLRSVNCLLMLVVNFCLYMSVLCLFSSSSSIVNSHIDNSWLNEVSCAMHVSQVLFKLIYSHQRGPTCEKLNILNKFHSLTYFMYKNEDLNYLSKLYLNFKLLAISCRYCLLLRYLLPILGSLGFVLY